MNPLARFRKLVGAGAGKDTTGLVISVEGETTKVRTPRGVVSARTRAG